MYNIDKILRKNTSRYILFIIFCVFINGKTLAKPEVITTENCKNIYLYLKNINNSHSENDHGAQLLEFLSKLCTKIYDKNLPKEEQITKDVIYPMLSKSLACPKLNTKTITSYTYSTNTCSNPIKCSFQPIINSKKHIATINFFLKLLQKKEEEACDIMFKTFTACMQTKALQTFVTCIKEECLVPLTVASAPPIEEKHTEENQDCYKQGLPTTYQPQPIQQLPQYPEPQHCVLSVPPPTHYQTLTEQHYPNIPPPSYTEKDTNEHSTSLHPAPTVVKTDENTNTATNELVQQIVTYSNDNERRNNNKHHKTKHPATLESVTDDITVLNIGCRNRNANPNSYTRTTFTSTRSSRPPNGKDQKKLGTKGKNKHGKSDPSSHKKNRKNTGTACTEPKDYVRSYTTNFAEEDNEYPLYRLSVHSPDDKYTFPLVYTQAKLVDQENEQEKGELDFFFEKVSCDPADLWHNQEDSLKRRTYIQTIVIFAKCNDQHPNAKFTVHINLEDRVAMRIMKNQSIREDNLNNEVKNFILGSTHTTTNLKTRDNTTPEAENDVSRTFYITEPEQQFEYDAIRYQHCVICAKTTNGQRHPFTILPYSATVDSSCNEVIGENLFNNRSNYLAITHAACVQTNWCPMQANKALFSYCTGYDHGNYCDHNNYADDDDIATDGAMAPNQHIVGTDDFATAGRYRIVDARNLIKKTTSLHQFPPVIYKIHCLDLDHKNEQDVHTALKFLEDVN